MCWNLPSPWSNIPFLIQHKSLVHVIVAVCFQMNITINPWPWIAIFIFDVHISPGGRRDSDGYLWITGRIDDMVNVSGHLLSTAEIESALVGHPAVTEAAVVSHPHPIKGECTYCFVTLKQVRCSLMAEVLWMLMTCYVENSAQALEWTSLKYNSFTTWLFSLF